MTFAGCASRPPEAISPAAADQSIVKRQLPNAPAWLEPAPAPQHRAGDDMIVIADRERRGRLQANAVIVRARGWYAGVVKSYAEGGK